MNILRTLLVGCSMAVLFSGAGWCAAGAAVKTGNSIDVYRYWPWKPGASWRFLDMSGLVFRKSYEVKSLGPSKDAEIRVLWPGGWLDYYREAAAGLERPKDFDVATGNYGVYDPPAIQYPHFTGLGEVYSRTALRRDYSKDGKLIDGPRKEEMTYVALGFEDVTVPAGTFKNCLKQERDYKTLGPDGTERRKIAISWNAIDVGPVRGCLLEFSGGKMLNNFCEELTAQGNGR